MGDEIPGNYETVDGIKTRARALNNELVAEFVENAEDRLIKTENGYNIRAPDVDPNDAEMLFHFGLLVGAAMEREYPVEE